MIQIVWEDVCLLFHFFYQHLKSQAKSSSLAALRQVAKSSILRFHLESSRPQRLSDFGLW